MPSERRTAPKLGNSIPPRELNEPAHAAAEDQPPGAVAGTWTPTDTDDIYDLDLHTGCRDHQDRFLELERRLETLIAATRHPGDADADTQDRLTEAMDWCAQCTIPNACYRRMTHFNYTGLAGARLLVRGRPYVPRKETLRHSDNESSTP